MTRSKWGEGVHFRGAGYDEGVEPVGGVEGGEEIVDAIDELRVGRIARVPTQRAELQRERPEFREHGFVSVAGEPLRRIHLRLRVRIAGKPHGRQSGGGGEGDAEQVSDLPGLAEQPLLPAELVGAEQPAEQPDVVLEDGHVGVCAEREVVDGPLRRLVELRAQAQQPQRVQRVHQRHPHAAPVVGEPSGHRLQLVVSERARFVSTSERGNGETRARDAEDCA